MGTGIDENTHGLPMLITIYDHCYTHDVKVHCTLWLGGNVYITKESHNAAKPSKTSSIIKVKGPDGKYMKMTNFSREQWVEISNMHVRDTWAVESEKLTLIKGAVETATNAIHSHRYVRKHKACEQDLEQVAKKSWGSGYQHQVAPSDEDFWFVHMFLDTSILT
jgi:hypothetical protein